MSSIGDLIDKMYECRETRKDLEKTIQQLLFQEKECELHLYNLLDEQGLKQAAGHKAQFSVTEKEVPSVTNWDKVYQFIADTNEFGLLYKRITLGLWKELNEEGTVVPGVETIKLPSYTLRVKK
jgi:hypothetical protein